MGELFAGPDALRAWAPTWPVTFWDLSARTADELLASDGPFTRLLAVVRAEQSEREEFKRVLSECARRLEPLATQDTMRWRDLLWLLVSWVIQRRPADERDELTGAVSASQQALEVKREATTVSETIKETWIQQHGRLTRLVTLRETLVATLNAAFGDLPAVILSSIQTCEDATKLQAAIVRVRTMTSLDEFSLT